MPKRTTKGQGIRISGGTSHTNHYKQQMALTPPAPPPTFKPLVVKPHPRQAEIDAFNAIPSRYA